MIKARMWIRALFTASFIGMFIYILWLLFNDSMETPDAFRDLLNIILGSFLVSFGKVIDFWFKQEKDE